MFFQDDTKGKAAKKAVAANAALVADAVRCLPLPVSLMPPYAVAVGRDSFSVTEESGVEDFTTFLTRPCVSINKVSNVTFNCEFTWCFFSIYDAVLLFASSTRFYFFLLQLFELYRSSNGPCISRLTVTPLVPSAEAGWP